MNIGTKGKKEQRMNTVRNEKNKNRKNRE